MKNILIINAHQFYENFSEGKLNSAMVDIAKNEFLKKDYQVKTTTIDAGYDINEEVEKHLWADIIITQSPVYWFNTPWIHKKYIDDVFTRAIVQQNLVIDDGRSREDVDKHYGTGGKMQGKKFMLSLTWNAPKNAFDDKDQFLFEGKSADDALLSVTTNYKFCGSEILPSFSCYDVVKNPNIKEDIKNYIIHIQDL
ncbi:MAG: NAD(P)H-dependent oxidoreductase [Campylobacteraceae bacterium]|nr:NAD(P)H-dependent oxidoreductase [Campylobacteraceae bacterium]